MPSASHFRADFFAAGRVVPTPALPPAEPSRELGVELMTALRARRDARPAGPVDLEVSTLEDAAVLPMAGEEGREESGVAIGVASVEVVSVSTRREVAVRRQCISCGVPRASHPFVIREAEVLPLRSARLQRCSTAV